MKSVATISTTVALLSGAADAFWRMECHSRTGLARLDPLVYPGEIGTHSHAIHGGSGFGIETTYDTLRESECSSCLVTEDKSAYWTPALNFIHENGTVDLVPQVGGMLAYYLLFGDDIKAFPRDFRMLAGDTRLRNFSGPVPDPEKSLWTAEDKTQHALGQKALGFNCLNYGKEPEPSMYRHFLPDKAYMDANCADGIRAEVFFPSCWNGKDTDSENHRDHIQYPDLVNGGTCPDGFETRVPSLFFETIWNTNAFNGVPGQFVWSNGDPTGYGYHGDFMTGWKEDFLQEAVNTCTDPSGLLNACAAFAPYMQSQADGAKCKFEMPEILKADNCEGPSQELCGAVPIQMGPEYASALQPGGSGDKPAPTETPSQAPSPPPILTEAPAVPTLSHKAPETVVTDKWGGGLSFAKADVSLPPDVGALKVSEAPQAPPSSTPAPALPVVTPAPAPPAGEQPKGSIIGTSTFTKDGIVHEVAIEEIAVTVYVTPTPAAAPKPRRHVHHAHFHRKDREHGLLGRF